MMDRLSRIRWPDVALAVVLAALSVWWTVHASRGDVPAMPFQDFHDGPVRPVPPGAFIVQEDDQSIGREIVLNLLITLAVVLRRIWPLSVVLVQFTAILAFENGADLVTTVATLIGVYSVCLYGRSTALSLGVLAVLATITTLAFDNTTPQLPDWAGVFALVAPIGLLGVTVRAARIRAETAHQRAEALERGQEAATRLAVAQERARIARELHDVVSHHVSVMTIQAGAAGKVIDTRPELARDALTAIEASGRETMTELRHLLGVLSPGPDDDLLHPQPGLDQLDALVDNVRRAGQPVQVHREPVTLPRGTDLTAYRVVQEALTNALRHAPGARTEITIDVVDTTVDIEVRNDPPPPGVTPASTGSGTGLVGLAERLRLYGGTLEAGPRPTGGFRVRASIPLDANLPAGAA
ncbi:sensor histidine kinase [Dactylosporangium sp. AC04546]|uniref:sensor histidine kinase n=1 Tax=Dactylosporangium sp. AC04546 TaxID=2862460 RepID=UPI001EDFD365|nr:sensor histidine kinase [Dactylosporangium sp. AC04546]WVK88564.1 sensor histidine kinase [Dactylosporangium sp. AC04546]